MVIPGIIAIRLQSGSYDQTFVVQRKKTVESIASTPRYGGWIGPVGPVWYQYEESQRSEISTDTIKTKGSYNPFGSGETVAWYHDYEKHERTHSTHDDPYPDENNPYHDPEGSFDYAHYYSTTKHDKEIHLGPGYAKGRVRDVVDSADGHTYFPDPPVYTDIEEDLFEGQTPPALPPNPPASLAMRGEPGGSGTSNELPPPDPALMDYYRYQIQSQGLYLPPAESLYERPYLTKAEFDARYKEYFTDAAGITRALVPFGDETRVYEPIETGPPGKETLTYWSTGEALRAVHQGGRTYEYFLRPGQAAPIVFEEPSTVALAFDGISILVGYKGVKTILQLGRVGIKEAIERAVDVVLTEANVPPILRPIIQFLFGRPKKADADDLVPKGKWPGVTTSESVAYKLRTYLLDPNHPVGGDKAKWFKEALGFTQDNLDDLARQIKFDPSKAVATQLTQHGQKYEQVIDIVGANGKKIPTLFVWIRNNDEVVRLVTSTLGAD